MSHSRKAAFIRVCHPRPVVRNAAIMSASKRTVVETLRTLASGRPRRDTARAVVFVLSIPDMVAGGLNSLPVGLALTAGTHGLQFVTRFLDKMQATHGKPPFLPDWRGGS